MKYDKNELTLVRETIFHIEDGYIGSDEHKENVRRYRIEHPITLKWTPPEGFALVEQTII